MVINLVKKYMMTIVLVILCIYFTFSTEYFFSVNNLLNVTRQVAVLGICGLGIAFIMLSGAIDLSSGSAMTVLAIFAAKMMVAFNQPVWFTIIVTLIIGTLIGFIIGFSINKLDIAPFIGTLAFSTTLGGIAYLLCDGKAISSFPEGFKFWGQGYIGIIPIPIIIMFVLLLLGSFILNKTVLGRYIYVVGGNRETARLSGLNPKKIKILCFSIAGFLFAIAGLLTASRLNSVNTSVCSSYSFDAITANMLGGVSAKGGVGRISGVLIGILIIGVLSNGMTLMNIQSYWQSVIKGVIMLFAVAMDSFMSKQNTKAAIKKTA